MSRRRQPHGVAATAPSTTNRVCPRGARTGATARDRPAARRPSRPARARRFTPGMGTRCRHRCGPPPPHRTTHGGLRAAGDGWGGSTRGRAADNGDGPPPREAVGARREGERSGRAPDGRPRAGRALQVSRGGGVGCGASGHTLARARVLMVSPRPSLLGKGPKGAWGTPPPAIWARASHPSRAAVAGRAPVGRSPCPFPRASMRCRRATGGAPTARRPAARWVPARPAVGGGVHPTVFSSLWPGPAGMGSTPPFFPACGPARRGWGPPHRFLQPVARPGGGGVHPTNLASLWPGPAGPPRRPADWAAGARRSLNVSFD